MGQATADLPDPLATSPTGPTSTDDLLAQLAGEEIERLLAETDIVIPPQPPETAAASVAQQTLTETAPSVPLIASAPAATSPEIAPLAAPAQDELEALFTQLDDLSGPAVATPAKAAVASESNSLTPSEEPSMADAVAAEMAEDAAQHARPLGHAVSSSMAHSKEVAEPAVESGSPSILVRLLAAVSAPLDACPDHVRDLIGKIAILTTLNALCVLAYVIFFRR